MSDESKEAPTVAILMEDIEAKANRDGFYAARGRSIEAYASMEYSLFQIFSSIMGSEDAYCSLVFFKITNSQARNTIVEKLIQKKFGNRFNLFWNSYFKLLRPLDITRNEIVHWSSVDTLNVSDIKNPKLTFELKPATHWDESTQASHNINSMSDFTAKSDTFSVLANRFYICLFFTNVSDAYKAPWLEIFQQPLIYPIPKAHPLTQLLTEPLPALQR